MAQHGWVKEHRKEMDSLVWANPYQFKLWRLLIMMANHADGKVVFNGKEIPVSIGSLVTGRDALAFVYNRGAQPVHQKSGRVLWRWIKKFEEWQMLSIKSTSSYSVISITNYTKYQESDQHLSSNSPALVQHLSTNKNDKNYKNEKKVVVGKPDSVDLGKVSDQWQRLWGFTNPVARQDLYDWTKEFGQELVGWVIDYAARRDVQSKGANRYLDRVFDGYRQRGITTVAAAEDEAKKHEEVAKANAPRPQRQYGRQKREEQTPDWARPDYKPAPEQVDDKTKADLNAQLAELAKQRAAAKKEEHKNE